MSSRNHPEALAAALRNKGLRVRATKSGWIAYPPNGTSPLVWHKSPSDGRWFMNFKAAVRRAGVDTEDLPAP